MTETTDPSSRRQPDDTLTTRLEQLRSKLDDGKAGKTKAETEREQSVESKKSMAQAFRLSSEFIAGIVVGGGIGYLIDAFFGTSPWGLIVFLLLGFCAAVVNVLRAAGMMNRGSYGTTSPGTTPGGGGQSSKRK